jgi:hypothetical protein
LSAIYLFVVSCNDVNTNANIHGNWKGIYNDHKLSFVFKSDNTCVFNFFDKQSNAFITINGNYELDFSKKPIPLSIRKIPQMNNPLFTIIEFINVDSIRIAEFSTKWRLRPISFENGKTINLIRIQSEKLN